MHSTRNSRVSVLFAHYCSIFRDGPILVPRAPRFFFKIASRVALVTEKNLNFLIGRLEMNAQQGTTFYSSTHNVFLPVDFQMLAHVYQPVEICRLHQQFQRFNAISMWLKAKL